MLHCVHPCAWGCEHLVIDDLPNTDYVMNNVFWLGVYPGLTPTMLGTIAAFIESAHSLSRATHQHLTHRSPGSTCFINASHFLLSDGLSRNANVKVELDCSNESGPLQQASLSIQVQVSKNATWRFAIDSIEGPV